MTKKVGRFKTAKALANAVGRHPGTVSGWIKRQDWPVSRRPPWNDEDLARLAAWVDGLSPNPAAPASDAAIANMGPEQRARLKKLIEQGKILELKRKETEGLLVDRAERERVELAQVMCVKTELMSIRSLAMKLDGMNLQQREQALEKWAMETCERMRNATF